MINLPILDEARISPDGRHVADTVSTPDWEQNGQQIAFLSRREGDTVPQIYGFFPFGGESRRLIELEGSIQTIAWSPDSSTIAFT